MYSTVHVSVTLKPDPHDQAIFGEVPIQRGASESHWD